MKYAIMKATCIALHVIGAVITVFSSGSAVYVAATSNIEGAPEIVTLIVMFLFGPMMIGVGIFFIGVWMRRFL